MRLMKKWVLEPLFFKTFAWRRCIPDAVFAWFGVHAALYKSPFADDLKAILATGDETTFPQRIGERLRHYHAQGLFDSLVPNNTDTIRRSTSMLFILTHQGYEMHVKRFELGAKDGHPPHAHKGIASAAMLLTGEIGLAESHVEQLHDAQVVFRPLRQTTLSRPADIFTVERHKNDLHYFYASKPSVIINVNVRGMYAIPAKECCRRYVDLKTLKATDELLSADFADYATAQAGVDGRGGLAQ